MYKYLIATSVLAHLSRLSLSPTPDSHQSTTHSHLHIILSQTGRETQSDILHPLLIDNIPLRLHFLLIAPETRPPEIPILHLHLREHHLMCLSRRQATRKESVHLLQWNTLGLGNEEVDEDGRADHEGGKEHIHAVVHGIEHLRSKAGDDEVL